MNIGILLFVILEAIIGMAASVYIVVSMFVVAGQKIYRKIRFHASLYD